MGEGFFFSVAMEACYGRKLDFLKGDYGSSVIGEALLCGALLLSYFQIFA
jgi:hypothetical protein